MSASSLYLPGIWAAVIQILFCSTQSYMSQIILWHVLELLEPILFIPYTVAVLSDKLLHVYQYFSQKLLDQKRQPTVPKPLCVVAVHLN